MALWEDLVDEIYSLTGRSDLVVETAAALRQATRQAHKAHKFWRDLREVTLRGLSTATQLQEISLANVSSRFRQMVYLYPAGRADLPLTPVAVDDLLHPEGYLRQHVCWGFGAYLRLRPYSLSDSYVLGFYEYPLLTPTSSYSTWIADSHSDVLTLGAASIVLAQVGEQEIAGRLDRLYAIAYADLVQDNLEIQGR